jgi:hypothetical protein
VLKRTPRERARQLWRWSGGAVLAGVVVTVLSALLPAGAFALSIAAATLFVTAILIGAIAASSTTRTPELVWIVAGILVFWVANSALYLHLVVEANSLVATVPPQAVIDLLSTLFVAGTAALVVAGVLAVAGWVVRPGRWLASHGPSGQS